MCVSAVEGLINRESHITHFCPVLRLIIELKAKNAGDDRKRNRDGYSFMDYGEKRKTSMRQTHLKLYEIM